MIHSLVANGNIVPCRFVTLDSNEKRVVQTGANGVTYGVSQKGTRRVPYSTLDDGYCAIAGEPVAVYGVGERCLLEAGGSVSAGNRLKSDSVGRGVAAATNLDRYGAIALHGGASGDLIEVEVLAPGTTLASA